MKYAKSKDINAFAIRTANHLVVTHLLDSQLRRNLLNFTLPSRQGVQAMDTPQRSIQLRQPGAYDWASSESGEKTVTVDSSEGSETEQVETEVTVMAAEHQAMSGVEKASSKPADWATNIPMSAWRRGSSSSRKTGKGEGSKKSPREESKKPAIQEAPTPSNEMAHSASSVNDEGAVLTEVRVTRVNLRVAAECLRGHGTAARGDSSS